MTVTIKNRFTNDTIATVEDTDSIRAAVIRLVKQGVDLGGAYLKGANLGGAYLGGAYLGGADLKLSDTTRLPTGETWKEYREEVLPLLMTLGGKEMAAVVAAWDCHDWTNCPMAIAYDFDGGYENASPLVKLLRPRIEQFVAFFDAKLIPQPRKANPR